jgi:hypothetical protein
VVGGGCVGVVFGVRGRRKRRLFGVLNEVEAAWLACAITQVKNMPRAGALTLTHVTKLMAIIDVTDSQLL